MCNFEVKTNQFKQSAQTLWPRRAAPSHCLAISISIPIDPIHLYCRWYRIAIWYHWLSCPIHTPFAINILQPVKVIWVGFLWPWRGKSISSWAIFNAKQYFVCEDCSDWLFGDRVLKWPMGITDWDLKQRHCICNSLEDTLMFCSRGSLEYCLQLAIYSH